MLLTFHQLDPTWQRGIELEILSFISRFMNPLARARELNFSSDDGAQAFEPGTPQRLPAALPESSSGQDQPQESESGLQS
eukprot:2771166-Rhodomonas_salina.1